MSTLRTSAVALTLSASMLLVTPAVSATMEWRSEVQIAHSDEAILLFDANHRGRLSVVAWQAEGDGVGALHLAVADDAGRGAFTRLELARDVDGMAVAACGEAGYVAYRQRLTDQVRRISLARIEADGGSVARVTIRRSVPADGTLDLACGSRRAIVAWTESERSTWHAFSRHVRLRDLARSKARDLGVAHRDRVTAAADGDRAYVSWSDARGLLLKRFTIGAGRDAPVSARPTRRLAGYGQGPMLAAHGSRVMVGFTDPAGDVELRASRDGGHTFPDGAEFGIVPGRVRVLSLAMQDARAVSTLELRYRDLRAYHRYSKPGGGSWTHEETGLDRPLDGFLVTAAGTKLVETFVRADTETDGWDLVFRRQR
jgi:hypothetical protein